MEEEGKGRRRGGGGGGRKSKKRFIVDKRESIGKHRRLGESRMNVTVCWAR